MIESRFATFVNVGTLRFQDGVIDQSRVVELHRQQGKRRPGDLLDGREPIRIDQGDIINRRADSEDLPGHLSDNFGSVTLAARDKLPGKLQASPQHASALPGAALK